MPAKQAEEKRLRLLRVPRQVVSALSFFVVRKVLSLVGKEVEAAYIAMARGDAIFRDSRISAITSCRNRSFGSNPTGPGHGFMDQCEDA